MILHNDSNSQKIYQDYAYLSYLKDRFVDDTFRPIFLQM